MAWNTNPEAEKSVLGAMLISEDAARLACAKARKRDFYYPAHQEIFDCMLCLDRQKKPIDLVTLDAELNRRGKLDSVGGLDALIGLSQFVPTAVNTEAYIGILQDIRNRRDFATLADRIRAAAEGDDFDAAQLTEKVRLYLKNMDTADGEDTTITEALLELYDEIFGGVKNEWAVKTGIEPLDELLDGLRPGRMYVIGARPGTGKTVLGLRSALKCAIAGKPVLYINREMERKDLLRRELASMCKATMGELKGGVLPEEKWEEVTDAIGALGGMPIHISEMARTPAEIRSRAVEIYEKQGLGLIVIDYLQRLRPDGRCRSRDEEVGQMSNAIKDLAMDLKVPVVLLCQLNRDEGSNRRPSMSRLRESGNIEQDADVVVLLHEPDEEDVPRSRQDMRRGLYQIGAKYLEMIVDKNRHGKVGIVPVAFYGALMRYKAL